jgi:mono/diheme cytochrome c family protein
MKNYQRITIVFVFTLLVASMYVRHAFSAGQDEQQKLAQQVVTIFQNNCIRCHGADMKSGLDLRTRESILKGGNRGAAIIPNNSKDSLLYQFISGKQSPRMPIGGELDEDEIEAIESWIDKGAVWPTTITLKVSNALIKEKEITTEHRKYWAFVPPVKSEVPKIAGYRNPIDAFIVDELKKNNLTLSPRADKATVLRRVTFDLTDCLPRPKKSMHF